MRNGEVMNVTESEAKQKWCPEVRLDGDNRFVSKTGEILWGGRYCIGSDCMMWRWAQKRNPNWKPDHGMMTTGWQQHPDDQEPLYIADEGRGYCGKAGA